MAVGLAPIDFANKSSESALSVYPIAIGNCKENRSVTTAVEQYVTIWCCLFFNVPHTVILETFGLGTARSERVKFDDEFYFI